ncbi:MAG TPA: FadR family transcriptional regulator [Desulfobacteraceae bacterium]|nr:FadR family transcriptional regulator [Desulfobacteraceae bacterium]
MTLSFTKMKPQKSYQHVVEQIQTAIFDGEIPPGERLPSEMKLKDMFETSRGTVREALRVLEHKGLVSIRTGVKGGARVNEANSEAMKTGMETLIRHKKVSLAHLAEFRELLEGHAAEQAARTAGPEDVGRLEKILAAIREHVADGPDNWDRFNRLDARFHQTLAEICGNPLLEANLNTIHDNIHAYFHQYLPFSADALSDDVRDLEIILSAVRDGDAKSAGEAARQHVAKFSRLMEASMPDTGSLRKMP